MACAGSAALERGLLSGSVYSDEGTAAHALGAMCLVAGDDPARYLGRLLHVLDGDYVETLPETGDVTGARSFPVNAEMVEAISKYVTGVRERMQEYTLAGALQVDLLVEQALPIEHITGEAGAVGTGDAVIIAVFAHRTVVDVWDLKYGRGVAVDAVGNEQGQMYALGALEKYALLYDFTDARITISQPRASDTPREWDRTVEQLAEFKLKASSAARLATDIMAGVYVGTPALVPGAEQCRFCKAKATCPALADYVGVTVGADFSALAASKTAIEVPSDLSLLGVKLAAVGLIEDWCKAIRGAVEGALFGANNSAAAQAMLGFKLVQGRRGNRAWSSAEDVEALLKKMRLKREEMYTFSLISPTVAETLLGAQPKRWDKVLPMITQAPGQPSVAPIDDKRAALVFAPADDFDAVPGGGGDLV